jgi:hypothetical protein
MLMDSTHIQGVSDTQHCKNGHVASQLYYAAYEINWKISERIVEQYIALGIYYFKGFDQIIAVLKKAFSYASTSTYE